MSTQELNDITVEELRIRLKKAILDRKDKPNPKVIKEYNYVINKLTKACKNGKSYAVFICLRRDTINLLRTNGFSSYIYPGLIYSYFVSIYPQELEDE